MLVEKILMQIKDNYSLKWPKPLHSLPNVRDKKKYCRFHRDHGHYMEDCRDLMEQIGELIYNGKLQNFVKMDESRQHKHNPRRKSEDNPRDKDQSQDRPKSAIGEIRMINKGVVWTLLTCLCCGFLRDLKDPQKYLRLTNQLIGEFD